MKIKIFFPLVALIFVISCNNDDDTTGSYIGTWEATNIEITECEDPANDDFQSVQCNDNSCYRIVFSADGTYNFQLGFDNESGTWTSSGAVITFCIEEDGVQECKEGIGTISGINLRLAFTSETDGCNTAYIMEKVEDTVDDGTDDGN